MKQQMQVLQKLNGVGEILSKRFVKTGYDTITKVAAAGEQGLKTISGLNPRMIQPILAQAGEMIREKSNIKAVKITELKQQFNLIKVQLELIALSVRDRFQNESTDKSCKKLERALAKVTSSLEKVKAKLEKKVKKAGKGLMNAEKRLAHLTEAKPNEIDKGLKKARKSLQRVYA